MILYHCTLNGPKRQIFGKVRCYALFFSLFCLGYTALRLSFGPMVQYRVTLWHHARWVQQSSPFEHRFRKNCTFVKMSLAQNDQAFPKGPLGLFERCGEPIAVGQLAMATDHGCRQTIRTDAAGSPISSRPSRLPTRDGKEACGGNSLAGEEERVGEASGRLSKGATSAVSNCC